MGLKKILIITVAIAFFSVINGCDELLDVDDQAPKLVVTVDVSGYAGTIDATNKACLIYYESIDWTNPWLMHCSKNLKIINPTVTKLNTYVALFHDANGSGTLDGGDAIAGYQGVTTYGSDLTLMEFYPTEIKTITLALVTGQTY